LVLLTLSMLLGVADLRRLTTTRIPRFVIDGLHRFVSLMVVAMVVLHVLTSLLDSFAPIRLVDAVVPFVSAYRPVWLGLGALAFDLLIALTLTSILRTRLGYRSWRAVHWLAYACWPVAFVHGLGTGSDIRGGWMLVISLACAVAVVLALLWRITGGWPDRLRLRLGAGAALASAGIALALWLPSGPLAKGWARRAGTPRTDLAAARVTAPFSRPVRPSPAAATAPTTAGLAGQITQSTTPDGAAIVRFRLVLDRGDLSALSVELNGRALPGGGISLDHGTVRLGTATDPARLHGPVASLQGGDLEASLSGANTASLILSLALNIDRATGRVRGSARIRPAQVGPAAGG
jgi:hypothetical protein